MAEDQSGDATKLYGAIGLAILGGSLSAAGANLMAWASYREEKLNEELSACYHRGTAVGCIALNLAGIGCFLSATQNGPVATIMPMQTAGNLMTNMVLQISLGIKYYTKAMRAGTFILVLVVIELVWIGPKDDEASGSKDEWKIITGLNAISWTSFVLLCTAICGYGAHRFREEPKESKAKLVSYTLAVSFSTVLGASIGKVMNNYEVQKSMGLKVTFFCAWCFAGVVMFYYTLKANTDTDVSLYIPAQLASQLIINMFTGLFVWGDWAKVADHGGSYFLVYLVSVMCVYLLTTDLDVLGYCLRNRDLLSARANRAKGPLSRTIVALRRDWQTADEENRMQEDSENALTEMLTVACECDAVTNHDMRRLVLRILRAQGGFGPNIEVLRWLEEDVANYREFLEAAPEFREALRDTLNDTDQRQRQRRLGSIEMPQSAASDGTAGKQDPLLNGADIVLMGS